MKRPTSVLQIEARDSQSREYEGSKKFNISMFFIIDILLFTVSLTMSLDFLHFVQFLELPMSMLRVFCCLTMLAVFGASSAQAAPPALTWDVGYPKPGTNAGEIDVKGSINIGGGLTTQGTGTIVLFPSNGGVVQTFPITLPANAAGIVNFGKDTAAGLTSGQEYTVTVQIKVKSGNQIITLALPTVNVKAK